MNSSRFPKGIVSVNAVVSFKLGIEGGFHASVRKGRAQLLKITHEHRGMCLSCLSVGLLDSEVKFDPSRAEPASAPSCKLSGFRYLFETEHVAVEGCRLSFASLRHGQLNVMESEIDHGGGQGIVSAIDRVMRLAWMSS